MKQLSFFLLLILLSSCAKETPEEIILEDSDTRLIETEIKTTGEGDCELEYAHNAHILDSSLDAVDYNNPEIDLTYQDADGNLHIYESEKRFSPWLCLHDWICPADSSIVNYFAGRPAYQKEFMSASNNFSFDMNYYASLNEITPTNYGDILTIGFNISGEQGEEHSCHVFTYVIDPRSDTTLSNEGLAYFEELAVNGITYQKVYQKEDVRFTIYFSVERGLLAYEDKETGESLVLIE